MHSGGCVGPQPVQVSQRRPFTMSRQKHQRPVVEPAAKVNVRCEGRGSMVPEKLVAAMLPSAARSTPRILIGRLPAEPFKPIQRPSHSGGEGLLSVLQAPCREGQWAVLLRISRRTKPGASIPNTKLPLCFKRGRPKLRSPGRKGHVQERACGTQGGELPKDGREEPSTGAREEPRTGGVLGSGPGRGKNFKLGYK